MESKEYKEALHYVNILIKNCTDAMAFVALKLEILILMNKIEDGISFSTSVQNQFIDNPEFLYWRGLLLVYSGNSDMGKKYIREALNKDPDNPKYQRQ